MKCQAIIKDYEDATRYNLTRVLVIPDERQCSRNAIFRLGKFCFCKKHCEIAQEGLIDDDGEVADRDSIRVARKYPKKFPGGLYSWARDLEPKVIEQK